MECGCYVKHAGGEDGVTPTIVYCPKHEAADDVLAALKEASDHLEYCGYGDSWERECAVDSGLPEKIESALARSGAPRPDVLGALEDLLTVQPRPVKIPGTDMNLTVSYTESDLLKMETARAVAAQARGGEA